jgi:hypothetical protein
LRPRFAIRSLALLLPVLAGAAGVGCSLALSFDGIVGGSPADAAWQSDAADDGSPQQDTTPFPPWDAATDSVGTDAPAPESGVPETGTVDSGPIDTGAEEPPDDAQMESGPRDSAQNSDATEASTTSFCASLSPAPVFCDDFDVHPLPGIWDTLTQTGGTVALDTGASVSPPRSLLATDSALATGQSLDAALLKRFTLPAPPTTISWSFQLQPVAVDTTAAAALVLASLDFVDTPGNRYSVQFTLEQDGGPVRLRLEEQSGLLDGGSSYVPHTLPDSLPLGAWTDVRLVMTRSGPTTASVQVSFGSTTELATTPLSMNVDATTLQMVIGSRYEFEPSQGWTTRYDNVVLNF